MNKLRLFALFFGLIIFGYASAFWGAVPSANAATVGNWGQWFEHAEGTGQAYVGNNQLMVIGKPNNDTAWALVSTNNYPEFVSRLSANESVPTEAWYNEAKARVKNLGIIACDSRADSGDGRLCIQSDQKTTTTFFQTNSRDLSGILQQLNQITPPFGQNKME